MEIKFCKFKKQIIEIEPKNEYFFNGKKQALKKVGHDWDSCSLGPCKECTKDDNILQKI